MHVLLHVLKIIHVVHKTQLESTLLLLPLEPLLPQVQGLALPVTLRLSTLVLDRLPRPPEPLRQEPQSPHLAPAA